MKTYTFHSPSHGMRLAWLLPVFCGLFLDMQFVRAIFGLPIDDAYIYVKYIRNLAQGSGYSFNPGETSFGVTSFLFTILGATGQKILPGLDPVMICQWLSITSHGALLWMMQRVVYGLTGNFPASWITGGFFAFCLPIFFTAPSGLETTFFLLMAVLVFYLGFNTKKFTIVWLGVGSAFFYLTRPEGLYFTLSFFCALLCYFFLFPQENPRALLRRITNTILYYTLGFCLIAFPYLAFVRWHSGHWMPTTYYGKLLNRSTFLIEPWTQKISGGILALTEGYQQLIAQDPTPFFFGLLLVLSLISFGFFLLNCGKETPPLRWFGVRAALFSFFAFPFIYGAVFRTSPLFGGYSIRYIQILLVIMHIEAAAGLHQMFSALIHRAPNPSVRSWFVRSAFFCLIPALILYIAFLSKRLEKNLAFYRAHVTVNEKVRKAAAQWIDQNTPPNARILCSNTGLGVVGAYCNRFVRDEGGLINPDIYPYLRGYSEGFNHWHKILEYMKALKIDYFTTFPPYGGENRHTQTVAEIEEPSLKDTPLEKVMQVRISRFTAPEQYDLFTDYPQEGTFVDHAFQPQTGDYIRPTRWNHQPVLALRTRSVPGAIQQRMIFPSHAHFQAGIAFDSQQSLGEKDHATVEIQIKYGKQVRTLFQKTYSLAGISPRTPLDIIEADLSEYSGKFAFLLLRAQASGPNIQGLWTGWITPQLATQENS